MAESFFLHPKLNCHNFYTFSIDKITAWLEMTLNKSIKISIIVIFSLHRFFFDFFQSSHA